MLKLHRPLIPRTSVTLEVASTAVFDDQPANELFAKLATKGARRLLPDGLTKTSTEVRGAYHGPIVPDYDRCFRPSLSIDDGVVERVNAISFVLSRHPREIWYLVLAVGWSMRQGTLPDADITSLVSERFPDAQLKAHDPRPRVLGAEEMAARYHENTGAAQA